MNNIVTVVDNHAPVLTSASVYQYSYGQVLRIQGEQLPPAVEIHFSLEEKGGDSVTRIGVTKDNVTDVIIPDSMLENDDTTENYSIYAFIFLSDDTSGETVRKIKIPVKARPKPEVPATPEEGELFREAIKAVNESAEKAEEAKNAAKTAAEDAEASAKSAAESAEAAENTLASIPENYTELIKSVDLLNKTKVTCPEKAQVGQALVVKMIDAEGKPTEFESKSMSGASTEAIKEAVKIYMQENPIEESDPTVPDWAKTEEKPNYTADEIGALPAEKLPEAIRKALSDAKESGEFNGSDGRGITSAAIKADGHLQIDYNDGTSIDAGKVTGENGLDGVSGVPVRIEKTAEDTVVALQPNVLYVFPEMSELTLTLEEAADSNIANEYHLLFTSPSSSATELSIPDTIKVPSSWSIDAGKIYELSILENILTYMSWEAS